MSFITILLIAIGLSMDSLAVSISGGICMKPFCIKKSLKMALTMGIFRKYRLCVPRRNPESSAVLSGVRRLLADPE